MTDERNRARPQGLTAATIGLTVTLLISLLGPLTMACFNPVRDFAIVGGALKTADQVEELLIQEIRQLGQATMSQWAVQAEQRVSAELQDQDSTVRSRRKSAEVVVCLWNGGGEGADLV